MSIFIRELDDQIQTGATPQLQIFQGGSAERNQLVHELMFRIEVNVTNSSAGTLTWTTLDWRRNSFLKSYFRLGANNSAVVHVDNVSVQQLGQLATTVYDGTLDNSDTEIPSTIACPVGTSTQIVTLRVPLLIPTMIKCADDGAVNLSEIGLQNFNFGAANVANLLINQIRVRAYARTVPCKTLRIGLYSRIESQICKAPQPKDVLQVGANEKVAYLALVSTDSATAVTTATFPIISQEGRPLIEGNRLDNVGTIGQFRGEAFYPQGIVAQTTAVQTEFSPLLVPSPYSKTSELVGGSAINCDYTNNGITGGRAFYTLHKFLALDPSQAAIRSGRDLATAERAVANSGKSYSADTMQFVPVEF
jgi:hypothetical protein